MWLTVRKQWYWAGVAASLAFFSWQPLAPYPAIALLCALAWSPGRRLRAAGWSLAGLATPFVALVVYYAAEGYPGKLFEGQFLFPLTGVRRPPIGFGRRLHWIFRNTAASYGSSGTLLWIGLSLLLVVAVWTVLSARSEWRAALLSPIILLVMLSLVTQVAYVLYDFIGWTHTFPLLPYGAVGFGAATDHLLRRLSWPPYARQVASVALLAGVAVLTAAYAVLYYQPSDDSPLRAERASACAIQRSLVPGTPLWTLGNPLPLVLLHRVNPDNYPYEGSGEDVWRVKHTPGGFTGWTGQIVASGASVVVVDDWKAPMRRQMQVWLRTHGYHWGYIGQWRVYVTSGALARMRAYSIRLTNKKHDWPRTLTGGDFRLTRCTKVTAG
jgi:hypothetical protein